LRFSLIGGGFVRKSLEAPVGEVVKLHVGQVIPGECFSVDEIPLGAFRHIVCPGSHRGVKNMRSLRLDSGTELIELTYQPEEPSNRLPDGGVGKVLGDRVQTEAMGNSQVSQCYSVSVFLLV